MTEARSGKWNFPSQTLKALTNESASIVSKSEIDQFGAFDTWTMSNGRMEGAPVLRGRHFELHKHQIFTSTFNGKLDKIIMIACNWFMITAAAPSAYIWKQLHTTRLLSMALSIPCSHQYTCKTAAYYLLVIKGSSLTYPSQIREAVEKSKAVPSFRSMVSP